MDISFPLDGYHVNFRVAGIVQHNNKMLFHKEKSHNYYALMGGRIQTGESSVEALQREVYEEMGKMIDVLDLLYIIENFFEGKNERYHEILFVYKMEFIDEKDREILDTIPCVEQGKTLQFEWIKVDELEKVDIRPKVIKKIVEENKFPAHYINKEIQREVK